LGNWSVKTLDDKKPPARLVINPTGGLILRTCLITRKAYFSKASRSGQLLFATLEWRREKMKCLCQSRYTFDGIGLNGDGS